MALRQEHSPARRGWIRRGFPGAVRLGLVALLFGWFYAWASPLSFPKDRIAGMGLGCLHGALMPLALPSLLLGKDVEIYSNHNTGRGYKLGYILGVDVCGLIFFGSIFWRPGATKRIKTSNR